jgi:diaminohydroxyphosphoribosylaminopyrimidine deaminase/5-amino-6-(5-phosphoribosylamino)uracil reductase
VLGEEVKGQLAGYRLTHTRGRPRVTLKLAVSLDGRIAPPGGYERRGPGRWLTGGMARRAAHRLRAQSDAVVIGAGTVRADDPRLTARAVGASRQPLRVVCDTRLRLPPTLRLLRRGHGTVVACCGRKAPRSRQRALESNGVTVWRLPATARGVSPRALLRRLGREGCHDVLLEGGAALAASWLRAGVVDRIALFTAPRVLGAGGLVWPGLLGRAWRGHVVDHGRAGGDLYSMIEADR